MSFPRPPSLFPPVPGFPPANSGSSTAFRHFRSTTSRHSGRENGSKPYPRSKVSPPRLRMKISARQSAPRRYCFVSANPRFSGRRSSFYAGVPLPGGIARNAWPDTSINCCPRLLFRKLGGNCASSAPILPACTIGSRLCRNISTSS